ncbi:MAG TPA: RNA polymerase sigma factor [Ignavibacteriaceae bacterium]|nr:RNA polymerase sigma factor [Ignavibacteriaceae bacterium]
MNEQKLNYINFKQNEFDALFSSAKEGDSSAFNKLSGLIRNISYSYFLSKLRHGKIRNYEDVDDLSNNVYLSFAEQYHKIENLENWLRRVLFLTFISWYKKTKKRQTFELDEAYNIEQKNENPAVKIDAEKILGILNTLSEDKQQIFKMRFWEDLKFAEIAENLGKSEDAVKKMFYRTIDEVKIKL